jgi:hypothetical protein
MALLNNLRHGGRLGRGTNPNNLSIYLTKIPLNFMICPIMGHDSFFNIAMNAGIWPIYS